MTDPKLKENAPDTTHGGRGQGQGTHSSDTTTRGIRIEVTSNYLPERSAPRESQYLFAYHVRVSNVGTETAQLVSRERIITTAEGDVERVKGPGVVGEQPVLKPGQAFEYTSGTPLSTSSGIMDGSYQMETEDGKRFDIRIPAFSLDSPHYRRQLH